MRYRLLCLMLLLCLTIPIQAQDEPSPYDIALQRIEEARLNNDWDLSLAGLGLTEVPQEIGELTQLRYLRLFDNHLSSLPPEIGNLSQLVSLQLRWNELTSLPPEIGGLTSLQILNLAENNLTELPPEIGQLTLLRKLDLWGNNLENLPSEIGNLRMLVLLDLTHNSLHQLPPELSNTSLDFQCTQGRCGLFVGGNPLISPPSDVVDIGTRAVMNYLTDEAKRIAEEQHRIQFEQQLMIIAVASGVALISVIILGFRLRQQRYKPKQKRKTVEI